MRVLLVLSLIFTGYGGVPFAGHAFWAEVGGGSHKQVLICSNGVKVMLYMLALVGLPSLRGSDACMLLGVKGAFWRNCRQNLRKTSFSPLFVFFSVESNVWFFVGWGGSLASLDW